MEWTRPWTHGGRCRGRWHGVGARPWLPRGAHDCPGQEGSRVAVRGAVGRPEWIATRYQPWAARRCGAPARPVYQTGSARALSTAGRTARQQDSRHARTRILVSNAARVRRLRVPPCPRRGSSGCGGAGANVDVVAERGGLRVSRESAATVPRGTGRARRPSGGLPDLRPGCGAGRDRPSHPDSGPFQIETFHGEHRAPSSGIPSP